MPRLQQQLEEILDLFDLPGNKGCMITVHVSRSKTLRAFSYCEKDGTRRLAVRTYPHTWLWGLDTDDWTQSTVGDTGYSIQCFQKHYGKLAAALVLHNQTNTESRARERAVIDAWEEDKEIPEINGRMSRLAGITTRQIEIGFVAAKVGVLLFVLMFCCIGSAVYLGQLV